jgi:hypothetical protein
MQLILESFTSLSLKKLFVTCVLLKVEFAPHTTDIIHLHYWYSFNPDLVGLISSDTNQDGVKLKEVFTSTSI